MKPASTIKLGLNRLIVEARNESNPALELNDSCSMVSVSIPDFLALSSPKALGSLEITAVI